MTRTVPDRQRRTGPATERAGHAVYDATKGAVEQFTHILPKEFGPRGITVNAVSPGATEPRRTGPARASNS